MPRTAQRSGIFWVVVGAGPHKSYGFPDRKHVRMMIDEDVPSLVDDANVGDDDYIYYVVYICN